MYYDHEGHAIATTVADAASTLTEHEKAQHFGYDCTCTKCWTEQDDAAQGDSVCGDCDGQGTNLADPGAMCNTCDGYGVAPR